MKRVVIFVFLGLIMFYMNYANAQDHACETWTCSDPTMGYWALTLNQDGSSNAVGGGLKVIGVDGAGSGGNESYCNNPILEAVNNWHGGSNACAAYFHTDDASKHPASGESNSCW